MTDDVDKMLAEATAALREGVQVDAYTYQVDRNTLALAEVLVATRRELSEVKAIVGTVPPEPDVRTFLRMAVGDRDPCPLAGQAGHECRWQLGVRGCVGESKLPYATPIDGSTPACLSETPRGLKTAREIVDAQIQERDKLRAEVAEYKEHVREAYEERDALKAALREACNGFEHWCRLYAEDRGCAVEAKDERLIAELRRLL